MFTFSRPLYISLLGAAVCLLGACDASGVEPRNPGPAMTQFTVSLGAVTANTECDPGTNPGDFQFRLAIADLGNNTVESITLPPTATYGVWSRTELVLLHPGGPSTVDRTVSFQQPRAEGSGAAVSVAGMEWDSQTDRNARMDDRTGTRAHRFASVVGTQQVTLGTSACNVTLDYVVTVQ